MIKILTYMIKIHKIIEQHHFFVNRREIFAIMSKKSFWYIKDMLSIALTVIFVVSSYLPCNSNEKSVYDPKENITAICYPNIIGTSHNK